MRYLCRTNGEIEYKILSFSAYQGIAKFTEDQLGQLGKLN